MSSPEVWLSSSEAPAREDMTLEEYNPIEVLSLKVMDFNQILNDCLEKA